MVRETDDGWFKVDPRYFHFTRNFASFPYYSRALFEKLGPPRYYVGVFLFLMMMALPVKMLLRWLINLKYIVGIPEIFFNI